MVNVWKEIYMLYVKPNNRSYEKLYRVWASLFEQGFMELEKNPKFSQKLNKNDFPMKWITYIEENARRHTGDHTNKCDIN